MTNNLGEFLVSGDVVRVCVTEMEACHLVLYMGHIFGWIYMSGI